MSDRQKAISKNRGRPATGMGQLIGVRLQPGDLARLDEYAARSEGPISRPEAIREILREHLGTSAKTSHPEPRGPATDLVKKMDAAIKMHNAERRRLK